MKNKLSKICLIIFYVQFLTFNLVQAQYNSVFNNETVEDFDLILEAGEKEAKAALVEFENKIQLESNFKKRTSIQGMSFFLKGRFQKFYKNDLDLGIQHHDSALYYFNKANDTANIILASFSYSNMFVDFNEISGIINKVLPMCIGINDSLAIYNCYSKLSRGKYIRRDFLAAFEYFKKGREFVKTENQYKKTNICHDANFIYNALGLHSQSLKYLNKYLKIQLEEGSKCDIIDARMLISSSYLGSKEYQKCIVNLNKIDTTINCSNSKSEYYLTQASCNLGLKKNNLVKSFLKKFRSLPQKQNMVNVIGSKFIEARLCTNNKEFKKAKAIYKNIIAEYKKLHLSKFTGSAHASLALCYSKTGYSAKAKLHIDTALSIIQKRQINKEMINVNQQLIEVYKEEKEYLKALSLLEKSDSISLLISDIKTQIIIKEGKYKLDNQFLEYENKALIKDNELKKSELNRNQDKLFYQTILLAILVIFLTLIIYFFSKYKKQKREKEKELLKKIEVNHKEITLLNKQLSNRQNIFKQQKVTSKESVLERLKITGDWIELFLCTEELFKVKFTQFSDKFNKLTKKDLKMIALTFYQLSNKEIADIIFISESGVKKSKQRIRAKLDIQIKEKIEDFFLPKNISLA